MEACVKGRGKKSRVLGAKWTFGLSYITDHEAGTDAVAANCTLCADALSWTLVNGWSAQYAVGTHSLVCGRAGKLTLTAIEAGIKASYFLQSKNTSHCNELQNMT